jgi:hypothetical protein
MSSTYANSILKLLVNINVAKQILQHDQRKIFNGKAQWIGFVDIAQKDLNSDPSETCLAHQNQDQGQINGCCPVY